MHFVTESATLNRRELKKQKTASELTSATRRFTAERGINGFTIEEVCAEVNVSRRTFFNYFATKDDAVIGANPDEQFAEFEAQFLAPGATEWPWILDDLVALVITHFGQAEEHAVVHREFLAAMEREPHLLIRFIGITRERERQLIALVARRQRVEASDPRAEASINVLSTLMRTTADRFMDPANAHEPHDFSTILTTSLAAARVVLASPSPRKASL